MSAVDQGKRKVVPTLRSDATSLHFCLALAIRHYHLCAWLPSKTPDLLSSDLPTSTFHPQVPVRRFLRNGAHPKDASVSDNGSATHVNHLDTYMGTMIVSCWHQARP